jgi:hypothetical protein
MRLKNTLTVTVTNTVVKEKTTRETEMEREERKRGNQQNIKKKINTYKDQGKEKRERARE